MVATLEALDLEHAPPEALRTLLLAFAATETRIAVRLPAATAPAPAPAAPETFIAVKAAAFRIGVAPKWLYRRKKTLPFMREIVPGTWRGVGAGARPVDGRPRPLPNLTGDPMKL